jgi:BASS family bile acid:Na+ symporter
MVITVGYLPLVLPLSLSEVTINLAKIAPSLIVLMPLSLGIGLLVKAVFVGLQLKLVTL